MKRLALLLGVLAIALFAACGEKADEATPAPVEDTVMVEVTITNGLEAWEIYSVLIDPSDETWGSERLGEEEILGINESFTVEIEEGIWDMMVIDEDGDSYTLWQVEIGPEGYRWNVTLDDLDSGWGEDEFSESQIIERGEGSTQIAIINDLQDWSIFWVYVDASDEPWGDELMGMDVLYQDDQLIVNVNPGTYDIKVEDEDGDTYTLWEVDVDDTGFEWYVTLDDMDLISDDDTMAGSFTLDTGDGIAPVAIVNSLGGWEIHYVYVDPSDGPWGEDRLGTDIILTGSSEIIVWVDPGTYDMQVQDEDGDTYTLWGIDVDENGFEWAVTLDDID